VTHIVNITNFMSRGVKIFSARCCTDDCGFNSTSTEIDKAVHEAAAHELSYIPSEISKWAEVG
jgi:hypothetical protein